MSLVICEEDDIRFALKYKKKKSTSNSKCATTNQVPCWHKKPSMEASSIDTHNSGACKDKVSSSYLCHLLPDINDEDNLLPHPVMNQLPSTSVLNQPIATQDTPIDADSFLYNLQHPHLQSYYCPFAFCPNRTQFRDSTTLKNHLERRHLGSSRSDCLSGNGLNDFTAYLRGDSRWFCVSCSKIRKQNRACSCGATFTSATDLPIVLAPGQDLPRTCTTTIRDGIAPTDAFLPHDEDENIFDAIRVSKVQTLPYIPMRCRRRVGQLFLTLLQAVTSKPADLNCWAMLQMFPKCVLCRHQTSKGFSGGSPADYVSSNLDEWDKGGSSIRHLWQQINNVPKRKARTVTLLPDDLKKHNIKRARKLAGHGRLSDACRALTSAGVVDFSESVMQELREKHPQLQIPCIPTGQAPEPLSTDWMSIWSCIKSFPRATACGRDGLRAQHLIDIMAGFSNDPRRSFFERQLVEFVNLLLKGAAPSSLAPFIASAPIVALQKQSGGIRPIAIGEIWRRLVSKVAQRACRAVMTDYLSPLQVGVGVKSGGEAVVHAVNSVLRNTQSMPDIGVLKIDFSNAFNLISRAHFFRVVRDICPTISAWVEFCYGNQAILYTGEDRLYSCTGVQQGDPLGPLLFALALHPLVLRIQEECPTLFLHSWYLDDGVMIGNKADLLKVLGVLQSQGPCLGLMLNIKKTEIWLPNGLTRWTDFPQEATFSFGRASSLLGCPISPKGEEVEELLNRPAVELKHLLEACRDLHDPQLQLLLLRACTGFPKINHLLRSAPPAWIPNTISGIDEMIHSALEDIWNQGISRPQRTLIGLPIRLGGFGIPVPSSAALSAYLGSRLQTLELQQRLINLPDVENSDMEMFVDDWNLQFPSSEQTTSDEIVVASKPQQFLNGRAHEIIRAALISASEPRLKTLIYANGYNHSGAWTTALPVSAWGTVMRPELFRLALRYRSGHLIFNESQPCSLCSRNQVSDSYGDHDSFCAGKGRLIRRHNYLRDVFFTLAVDAHLGPRKEVSMFLGEGGDRPADILIPLWERGLDVCIDFTVVSPFTRQPLVQLPGESAIRAEKLKRDKYERLCRESRASFKPFVMESTGGFGPAAECILQKLSVALADTKGEAPPAVLSRLRQQLSFAVQITLAAGFLHRDD